jgi:signal transduction histidine kinase
VKRRLLAGYLGLTAFVLAILVIPLGVVFARAERDRLIAAVERDAVVMAGLAEDFLDQGLPADLSTSVERYAQRTGGRVVIVDRDGTSIGDSDLEPGRDYSTRPEFDRALRGEVAAGSRFSETLGHDFLYVAVPVASGGRVHGAVRITFPTAAVESRIRRTWVALGVVSAIALTIATLLSLFLARTVTRPIGRLTVGARDMAAGRLDTRVEPHGPPELQRLAQSFNAMAAQLSALLASHEAFVADASHQLRSPLAALRLRLENLEPAIAPEAAAELQGATTETMRLSRLVDGLLALSRADAARSEPVLLDLGGIVQERQRTWAPLADEQGVRLEVQTQPVPVRVVPGTLEQVLDNLIANALRVAPSGTAIRLGVEQIGNEALISVTDEGPGMTAEERERAARASDWGWPSSGAWSPTAAAPCPSTSQRPAVWLSRSAGRLNGGANPPPPCRASPLRAETLRSERASAGRGSPPWSAGCHPTARGAGQQA